jgi:hypothetical protein
MSPWPKEHLASSASSTPTLERGIQPVQALLVVDVLSHQRTPKVKGGITYRHPRPFRDLLPLSLHSLALPPIHAPLLLLVSCLVPWKRDVASWPG